MLTPGKRLKMARELTHINRTVFCQRHKISINSMNAWETDQIRFSDAKASMLCQTLSQEGVHITLSWLLTGIGDDPQYKNTSVFHKQGGHSAEDDHIWLEISRLKQHYGHCIVYTVNDDSCMPFYKPGDVVAGVAHEKPTIIDLYHQFCIIELINSAKVIRRIDGWHEDNLWQVSCINKDSQLSNQNNTELELKSIVPIIWFRRKIQNESQVPSYLNPKSP